MENLPFEDAVAVMIPPSGDALHLPFKPLTKDASGNSSNIRLSAVDGLGVAMLKEVPKNARITFQVNPEPNSSYFGLYLRGSENYRQGHELRFEPGRQKVGFRQPDSSSVEENERSSIYCVEALDRRFILDIIVKDDIIDVCVDNRRTLVNRVSELDGDLLFFFCQNSEVTFDSIEVRPLL